MTPVVFGQAPTCNILDGGGWSGLNVDGSPAAKLRPWLDPLQALIDATPHQPVAWHSDGPKFFPLEPLTHLWSMVTRDELRDDGSLCEAPDWLADGGLSVEQALELMTINAAYALQMNSAVGSLKYGKFADMVILSDDPLTVDPNTLIDLQVLMTMVGGRVEYCGDSSFCDPPPRQAAPPDSGNETTPTETAPAEAPDVIFFNGHVITIEPDMPSAQALAALGEKILHIGTDEELLAQAGPDTQLIDLGGRTLMPGFVDPHTHPFDLESPESLEDSQRYTLQGGITTVGDANASPDKVESFLSALQSTDLRIRTSLYLAYNTKCNGLHPDDWWLDYPRDLAPNLRLAGVKIIGDPAGPRTYCGWAPLSVPLQEWIVNLRGAGPYGDLLVTEEEMTRVISENQARGYQVIIHSRGDVTVDTALNAIEAALDGEDNTFRHRIEHNDFIRPDQLARYSEIGVLPTIRGRPTACLSVDTFNGFSGFGPDAEPWYRIARSLIDANPDLPIAWHGDTAGNGRRPIQDLYDWVTRKEVRSDGTICEPPEWLAAEAITAEEALRLMTINGAYLLFMEDKVGSLKPGKLADMIILSDNPLTMDPDALKDLEVLMTMVGGQVEHCADDALCPQSR